MDPLASLIGQSPGMVAIHAQVRRLLSFLMTARRVPPVLLLGETGTGKGLLARSLHTASPRATGAFISVNCAAIPDTLLEAELFGYERGAFTDARQAKPGLFQQAHGGTLFLDEAGLLPEHLQAKLLTALDERAVRRLGGIRVEPTDCWIIAATSADLEQARRDRRFREDLYHRLSVFTLRLPPLRERGDDVLRLADAFLASICADYGLAPRAFDAAARRLLVRYTWPGNVRELSNVVERAALLSGTPIISADSLGLPPTEEGRVSVDAGGDATEARPPHLRESLDDLERSELLQALDRARWNVSVAAEILGVPRNTLRYRIDKHGLTRPDEPVRRRRLRERLERPGLASESEIPGGRSARTISRPNRRSTEPGVTTPYRRALAFLRVSLTGAVPSPSAGGNALHPIAEKAETFGGHILRHADGDIDAAFGLEPTEDAAARAASAALAIRRLVEHRRTEHPGALLRVAIETLNCLVVETTHGERRLTEAALEEAQHELGALIARHEADIVVGPNAIPYLERLFSLTTSAAEGEPGVAVLVGREVGHGAGSSSSGQRRSPFVGRAQELTLLEQRLRQVTATGRGHLVGLMGEPGMGKSRLLAESQRVFAGQGATIFEGHCASHAMASPYSLLIDLLRRAWQLDDLDMPAAVRSAVTRHLAAVGLEDCEPELSRLLGVRVEEPEKLSPAVVKTRIFNACQSLFIAHARAGPLALVLEDLHWADQTSQEFVGLLVDSLPGAPVLVVTSTRPGYRAAWVDRSWVSQLALPQLSPEDCRDVIRALRPELDAAWVETIVRRAEGNPFFLEELAWSVNSPHAGGASLPRTIEDVLSARIDRLAPRSQRLLEVAAVLGRAAPLRVLEALTDDRDTLARDLGTLTAQEFLHELRDPRGLVYAFKHALTQDVAYRRLAAPARQRLHAVAGLELERLHAGMLDAVLPELARHALHAELWDRGYGYLHAAAVQALGTSAFAEAAQLLEQALDVLQRLPATVERDRQTLQSSLELWSAYWESGQYAQLHPLEQRLEPLGRALGQEAQLAALIVRRTQILWGRARPREVVATIPEVLRLAAPDDIRTRSYACFLAGSAYRDLGCVPEALASFDDGVRLFDAVTTNGADARLVLPILVNIHAWRAELYALVGRRHDAYTVASKAITLARSLANDSALVFGNAFLGYAKLLHGEVTEALPILEEAYALFAPDRYANATLFAAAFLAYGRALAGQPVEALALLQKHFRLPDSRLGPTQVNRYRTVTTAAYLAAGRPGEALDELAFMLPIARQADARGHLPTLLRLHAEALLEHGSPDVDEIRALCEEAHRMAASVGLKVEVAHCLAVLGRAEVRARRIDSGRTHLEGARTLYRQLDTNYWLARLHKVDDASA
jgi:DNA-binding NtrC family response regulator/tetratricopeptide (TPR) repeat protein